jgi:hypothetical protein
MAKAVPATLAFPPAYKSTDRSRRDRSPALGTGYQMAVAANSATYSGWWIRGTIGVSSGRCLSAFRSKAEIPHTRFTEWIESGNSSVRVGISGPRLLQRRAHKKGLLQALYCLRVRRAERFDGYDCDLVR